MSVCFMLQQVSHLLICSSAAKCTFFPNEWVHFSSNEMVSQTVTRTKWNKWSRHKISLNFLFGIQKYKTCSYDGTKVVTIRGTAVSFLLGLSNNSSKLFFRNSFNLGIYNFLWVSSVPKPSFQVLKVFWKVNGDEQSLLIHNPWL